MKQQGSGAKLKKRPTLKTISGISGFSVATVSRALGNDPAIKQATRDKVQEIAREIGYRPNREGLRLKTGKTQTIALILGIVDKVSDHSGRMVASVARTLRDTPYSLIVTPYSTDDDDPLVSTKFVVENHLADAVIIEQIEEEDRRVRYLLDEEFPFATFGRGAWIEDCAYYDFDNEIFGQVAAKSLIDRGRRALLLIAPPLEQSYGQHMISGITKEIEPAGGTLELLCGVHSLRSRTEVYEGIQAHLARGRQFDGFICCSSTDSIMLLRVLRELGLRPGHDVDVFTKESIPQAQDVDPNVMCAVEDVDNAGRFLAEAAIHAIEHPDQPRKQKLGIPSLIAPRQDT